MEEDHIVHIVHTVYPAFSHIVADITLISLGFIIVNDVYYYISPDCISHLLVDLFGIYCMDMIQLSKAPYQSNC